jgi:hypothetical protein
MSRTRNRKGENYRRRKRTLLKKAYEYGELSGADIAVFIYKSGRWVTYRSTNRQSFRPSWEQIVSVMTTYIRNANENSNCHIHSRSICFGWISNDESRIVAVVFNAIIPHTVPYLSSGRHGPQFSCNPAADQRGFMANPGLVTRRVECIFRYK